jgi:hypothetical protein
MTKQNLTKQNIGLASKLLRMEEQKAADKKAAKKKLEEGTPTQALPPESNATRQLDADVAAAMNKGGIPTPIGIEPKQNHNETGMGTQDPMGADAPVKTQYYATKGQQDGMVVPAGVSQVGASGPSDDTQGQNTTSGLKGKKPTAEDIVKLEGVALVEAFVEFCGGVDEAIFKLLAEGVSLVECESALVDKKVEEGLFDRAKAGISAALGGAKPKPTQGYIQHLKNRQSSGGDSKPSFVKKSDTPWAATRNAGNDARRNK